MKVSKLFVGMIALSLAAGFAQAAPSSSDPSGLAGPGPCLCFTDPAGGGVCGTGTTSCGSAIPCAIAGDPACPAGFTCIDGASSCCGFSHCEIDCPAGTSCINPTVCGGLAACQNVKPEDCDNAIPAPGPVTPCNDTTPKAAPWMSCAAGGTGLKDKWVSFVASSTAHRVRTDVASTGSDSSIEVYSGPCASLVEIGCNGDISGSNYLSDLCVGGLNVGETYYVRVGAYNDGQFGACNGDYAVTVEAATGTVCGDGVVSCIPGTEECDDGNTVGGDCCSADCRLEVICGNGCVEGTEQCDDGNLVNGDGCDSNCVLEDPPVPAVSEWGLLVLVLIGLTAGTVIFGRKQVAA